MAISLQFDDRPVLITDVVLSLPMPVGGGMSDALQKPPNKLLSLMDVPMRKLEVKAKTNKIIVVLSITQLVPPWVVDVNLFG